MADVELLHVMHGCAWCLGAGTAGGFVGHCILHSGLSSTMYKGTGGPGPGAAGELLWQMLSCWSCPVSRVRDLFDVM